MNAAEFAHIAQSEKEFWWYRGMRKILFGILDPLLEGRRLERVLEAGCGTGYTARLCQQRYGWRIYPADLSGEALRYARGMGLERLAQADLRALPFRAGAFDLLLSLDAVVYLPRGDEESAMREIARVLAPGGLLVLRAAAFESLRSRHAEFTGERQRFTRRQLAALAERHGVRVLRSTYANSLLLPVALARFRIWEPLLRTPVTSGIDPMARPLEWLLYLPLALEAGWLAAGHNLPAGQSVILIGERTGAA